ncbi:zinc finger HIT domain-containing protein 2 [Canna indica]|uniref:Zinc finger HIT domain-containing protein 2 n=1 Tax=Canna indica TaxID=4628 RepID=A0AAQ3KC25_9LILI|nr:zinc finger HIT domain-containing protein 2 [Canna indica]
MEEVIVKEANPSTSTSELRIICRVCQKQFSQYTCPRCNSRYCSLQCYKRHSLRCTESFMRENVMEELKQVQPDDESKRKMLDILKRFHSEEEMSSAADDDDDDESMLSEEIIQKVLSGQEVKLEDLSHKEIKQFRRAIASGELSKLIEPWTPWWRKPSARSISLSPEGCQLVKSLDEQSSTLEDNVNEIPVGPESPLPPLRQLMHGDPSPLLAVHVVDVLYSYCFTLRLYNGDWHSDPLGAATVALSMSKVMGDLWRPETVGEALTACLEETCSPVYRHAGGFSFGIGLVDDVICLLYLGTNALICLLCDLQRLIQTSERTLKSEKIVKTERSQTSRRLRSADKKVFFLMCWVHEQPAGAWSTLASIVEMEKASLSQLGLGGKHFKAERKGVQQSKLLIEEV